MKKVVHLIAVSSLITVVFACNDTSSDGDPDAGLEDVLLADTDADVDVDDEDTSDPLDDWPGQELDEEPLGLDWDMPPADDGLKFLIANVGNIDLFRCTSVAFNMCWTEQEEIVIDEIAARDADVILLQEVTTAAQCQALEVDDLDDDHVCHPDYRPDEPEQVRRLVGPDYTIACDSTEGYECVAARVGRVSIPGCDDGDLCRGLARTNEAVDGCDPGFTVSAVTIEYGDRTLDVVNVHPPSGREAAARQCRHDYFLNIFGEDAPLIEEDQVLIGGDFNFDPYRGSQDDVDIALWNDFVSTSFDDTRDDPLAFAYHSGLPEHDPPYHTSPLTQTTLDHVISNSLQGRCTTLGAQPGEPPLDHFHGDEIERLDHLAIECILD